MHLSGVDRSGTGIQSLVFFVSSVFRKTSVIPYRILGFLDKGRKTQKWFLKKKKLHCMQQQAVSVAQLSIAITMH